MLDSLKNIFPLNGGKPNPFNEIINTLNRQEKLKDESEAFLWKAYQFGESAHIGQKRRSGEPYFNHCSAVGNILASWGLDENTIIAGLLHDTVEDTDISLENISEEFNQEIADLIEGVTKLSGIKFYSRQHKQAENFMKMFLSVAKDIRVIIIKFADRLHNMKTLEHLPLIKQRRIANETKDVYAPLAHRLGMNKLKSDYEDLIFKTVKPKVYKKLLKKVKSSKADREKFLNIFIQPIVEKLENDSISYRILKRTKHYSSIQGKIIARGKPFEEIMDIMAIRVIVTNLEDCYTILGYIHGLYTPLQARFKDFISTPKKNGYRSLHTTVFGKNGRIVEIQIRTEEMDKTAEIGIAAHWAYKEGQGKNKKSTKSLDKHISWLRELVEVLQDEDRNEDPKEFLQLLKIDLFEQEIFIFSPKGDVYQLKENSTPVDFAFEVHTEVGMHCIGAKINGKIVPLNTKLKNGDSIEIITSESKNPSYAWLKFVQTIKAKTNIKKWVNKEQNNQSISLGKEILEKTLRRLKKKKLLKEIIKSPQLLGVNSIDQVYIGVSNGSLMVRDIIEKYTPHEVETKQIDDKPSFTQRFLEKARGNAKGVNVDGISNTLMNFGKCCNPIPGEEIIGYITRGRGVTIHRNSCKNLPVLDGEDRFIDVDWNVSKKQHFLVPLKVIGEDRKHFLNNITAEFSNQNINISSIDAKSEDGMATINLVIEVRDRRQLARIRNKIRNVKGLIYLERV
ncbi:MAG: bifunctional (p)ppGpp synthetase/guanosine-3',5'-bis(diphosphate) 3'-pyrophosphohydrolase [Candidatus Marinimicrobia bacterium]|nr:bifunctional (p)ppGpp synthetase/guanosine-3',5'-bis(diphosphate) 3'-pyrophosphohydrolase [Candidatus Neomarinimicrobiota bacterium]